MSEVDYQFNAKPKVVGATQKYRESNNIMWDKRVVRGNTYSSIVTKQEETTLQKKVRRKRQTMEQEGEMQEDDRMLGREHQEVQTDENVELLTDKPPNYEKEAQTDFIIEKIVPRMYMQPKTGTDVETQVWDDGELFNFEYEVEPVLLVLVGKTLEISRMEVLEEEELREMSEQQKYYTQLKLAEMAEQERLEQAEQRLHQENLKRKQQFLAKKQLAIRAHEKMVSRVLSKQVLNRIHGHAISELGKHGLFRDPMQIEMIQNYLPWIYGEIGVELNLDQEIHSQYEQFLAQLTQGVCNAHHNIYQMEMKNRQEMMEERERLRQEEEERQMKRREAKKRRLELERRQRLREAVIEKLISKGEMRPNSINYLLSDLDGFQQNQPFFGLFGGIVGELIILLSAFQELANEGSHPSLKPLFTVTDNTEDLLLAILNALILNPECIIEFGIGEAAEALLQQIDPELSIQALNGQPLASAQIQLILQENLFSTVLPCIQENFLTFGFNKQLIDQVINSLIKNCLNNEQIRPKTRFVKVNPLNNAFSKVQCFSKMKPSLTELPFHPKSGKTRPDIPLPSDDPQEPIEEVEIINPKNYGEAEVENKATPFAPLSEDISTLVQHSVTEYYFRDLVIECIAEVITLDAGSEYQLMIDITDKCDDYQNAILDVVASELPVLDINQY